MKTIQTISVDEAGEYVGPGGGGGGGDASAANQVTQTALLTDIETAVDGIETLLTAIDGRVDGLETLVGTTNSTLTTIDGRVDGLETLVTSTNTKLDSLLNPTFTAPASGELQGSATALQGPSVACKLVMFTALASNAGKVYLGAAGVTIPNGTTDATSGIELAAGASTPWIPVDNLSRLYRICENAGDDLVYLAMN